MASQQWLVWKWRSEWLFDPSNLFHGCIVLSERGLCIRDSSVWSDRSSYTWRSMLSPVDQSRHILAMPSRSILVLAAASSVWLLIQDGGVSASSAWLLIQDGDVSALRISEVFPREKHLSTDCSFHLLAFNRSFLQHLVRPGLYPGIFLASVLDFLAISHHHEMPPWSYPNIFLPFFLAFFIPIILSICPIYPWWTIFRSSRLSYFQVLSAPFLAPFWTFSVSYILAHPSWRCTFPTK